MDIEFAHTFLVVAGAGNFVSAARILRVSQSTVSARIQALEKQMGGVLFKRGKGGAELTQAGRKFLPHATTLVKALSQAHHEINLPAGYQCSLTLRGCVPLWDGFLPRWVGLMRASHPDISLHLEAGFEEDITQAMIQGVVDVGVTYSLVNRAQLDFERLFDETLVLVSSNPARSWPDPGYIHIDWGPEFSARFSANFPHLDSPAITTNTSLGSMQTILNGGGSGYLPWRVVRGLVQEGRLWTIEDAPTFTVPAYVVFHPNKLEACVAGTLDCLRILGAEENALPAPIRS